MRRLFWHWLPPLAWMVLIFVLSAQPDLPHAPGPWLDVLLKKTGHAVTYGVLAWLYWRALRQHTWEGCASTILRVASVGLAVAYGLSDEYHQTFVPGRTGRPVDVAIDGMGACAAMLLDWWLERRRALPRQASAVQ
jgi:VanZ family protein